MKAQIAIGRRDFVHGFRCPESCRPAWKMIAPAVYIIILYADLYELTHCTLSRIPIILILRLDRHKHENEHGNEHKHEHGLPCNDRIAKQSRSAKWAPRRQKRQHESSIECVNQIIWLWEQCNFVKITVTLLKSIKSKF